MCTVHVASAIRRAIIRMKASHEAFFVQQVSKESACHQKLLASASERGGSAIPFPHLHFHLPFYINRLRYSQQRTPCSSCSPFARGFHAISFKLQQPKLVCCRLPAPCTCNR